MVPLEVSTVIEPVEAPMNSGLSMVQTANGYSVQGRRGALLATTNRRIDEWGEVLQDPLITLAAVDRQVNHPILFERNVLRLTSP